MVVGVLILTRGGPHGLKISHVNISLGSVSISIIEVPFLSHKGANY